MSLAWMIVVLFAAALHASWNAITKAGPDKFNDTVLVTIGAPIIPGLLLPWVPFPASASLPFLVASVIIHFGYFSLVALAYRAGDMSYAYPIMLCTCTSYGLALYARAHIPIALVAALRETSAIFGTVIAAVFLGERFGPVRYVAAGLVTAGAIVMKVF